MYLLPAGCQLSSVYFLSLLLGGCLKYTSKYMGNLVTVVLLVVVPASSRYPPCNKRSNRNRGVTIALLSFTTLFPGGGGGVFLQELAVNSYRRFFTR